ncbi:hypothetical protein [Haloactinopolyspora sp.]|uniref:hypothetical protein n=1 Tax=Haloactinopolyspora sp. TaxID=1966353 RepID=UPI00261820D4|nr:hypothetical protein [Haloactinopolyspora sp.]
MSDGDEEGSFPNPYRATIATRRGLSRDDAEQIASELADAVTAMDNSAWVSSTADDFYAELTGHVRTLNDAGEAVMQEFSDAIEGQPKTVEPNAWQTRWRNL